METGMRKLLLGLGVLVLVAVAGGLGATWWFLSRFDARAEIVQRVKAATGRDFALTGPVSVSFWPAIGFRGEGAALANVQGGVAPHLMEAKAIVIGVALRPLLDQRLEVTKFVLTEPALWLEVDAENRPNWILKPSTPAPPRAPGEQRRVTEVKLVADIADGRISYANARTRSAYALSDMDLKVAMQGLDQPLEIDGAINYRDKPIDVDLTVGAVRALMTGKATPVSATLEADIFKLGVAGTFYVDSGALTGDMTATGPSLRNLAAWAGSPFGPGYGLETFALKGKFDVGARRFAFENAGLQIDDIKARGDFVIESGGRVPFLSGRLEIADAAFDPLATGDGKPFASRMPLNLNPYFGAPRPAAAGAEAEVEVANLQPVDVEAAGWSEARLNFDWLKALNTNLEITTGPLRVQSTQIDAVFLQLTVLDGYLAATLQRMELYGGDGSGRFEIDARVPKVVVRTEIAAQNLRAKDFFRDSFGFGRIEGAAGVKWKFSSTGTTQKEMMSSLAGEGDIAIKDGALTGVDLGGVARTIRNALRGELISANARTQFTNFSASIRAFDGVIATQNLRLDSRDARLTGAGVIDAGRRSLDFRIVPRLGSTGLAVPFRVNGPWKGFTYASDLFGRARGGEAEQKARAVPFPSPRRQ
jgi:AsmA protein